MTVDKSQGDILKRLLGSFVNPEADMSKTWGLGYDSLHGLSTANDVSRDPSQSTPNLALCPHCPCLKPPTDSYTLLS